MSVKYEAGVVMPMEQLQGQRAKQLCNELAFALSRTDGAMLGAWGRRAAGRLPELGARRVAGLCNLAVGLASFGGKELGDVYQATRGGRFGAHFAQRSAAAIDGTLATGSEGARFLFGIGRALVRDPRDTAPRLLGAFLGFYTGSGGIDGNGGVPDLDLMVGIGHHRSPLTHSILAGMLAEGVVMALVDLAAQIHDRLPHDHDVLWDGLARVGRSFTDSASVSLSAGIAWHLLVDAGIEPAPYHDLPFSMPIEAHQAVFAANGVAEGVDAAGRAETMAQGHRLLEPEKEQTPTTGERTVAGVADAAQQTVARVWETAGAIAKSMADRVWGRPAN